jgi:hypothetical protein
VYIYTGEVVHAGAAGSGQGEEKQTDRQTKSQTDKQADSRLTGEVVHAEAAGSGQGEDEGGRLIEGVIRHLHVLDLRTDGLIS